MTPILLFASGFAGLILCVALPSKRFVSLFDLGMFVCAAVMAYGFVYGVLPVII